MNKFIITIILLLSSCVAFNSYADNNKAVELKVISYNIRNGEANDGTNSWKYRFPATMLMLDDQKPDVFGVQEAYDYQIADILEYTKGYKAVGVGREDGKHEGEHMDIFWNTKNIKMLKWGTYWLSPTPSVPSIGWDAACRRTATWALMKDKRNGKKFWFVNTHLDHVGVEARKNGLALIVERIKAMNPQNYPMVLTGDFNITPEDNCLTDLNTIMNSAREAAVKTDNSGSFNDWGKANPPIAIDYIYYSGFTSCLLFEVINKPYYNRQFISDHFPVAAVLVF